MDGLADLSCGRVEAAATPLDDDAAAATPPAGGAVARAQVRHDEPGALARLRAALGPAPLDLVLLFVTPRTDADAIAREAAAVFGDTPVMGCTTAGEIGARGYAEGEIVALGLPRGLFRSELVLVEGLAGLDARATADRVAAARLRLACAAPALPEAFAFLLVDGLSAAEDALAAALTAGLGGAVGMPLVGGSAGDGDRYGRTFVLHGGRALTGAALIALVRSGCPVRTFQTDHLVPTETRMVVTAACPERRLVTEINAEPAAREYARLIGRAPEDLSALLFAANPLVVRAGGRHHVRAIQQVEEEGLRFFSAIAEGLVLTLARTGDIGRHLERELAALSRDRVPEAILACDCTLRRVEVEHRQLGGSMSALLARHRMVGFSTYGEQIGALHVNQTMTGVAIYPPRPVVR